MNNQSMGVVDTLDTIISLHCDSCTPYNCNFNDPH